ncbi:MAG: hypothetical protein RLZ51_1075 [Pseudomonadota bacterium]
MHEIARPPMLRSLFSSQERPLVRRLFRSLALPLVRPLALVAGIGLLGASLIPDPALANPKPPAATATPLNQRAEQGGLRIELALQPQGSKSVMVGEDTRVRLRLTDAASGQPLTGVRPRAWMARMNADLAAESCEGQVKRFVSGRLSQRADHDMNVFHFITLNQDQTVTVINPQVSMNVTKLESIVQLPANGDDWVLLDDRDMMLVTMPSIGSVAIVDLKGRRLVNTLKVGGEPRRIVLQPDGAVAWVALDQSDQLVAIDTTKFNELARIPIGAGFHGLLATSLEGPIAVTSSKAEQLTLIDPKTRTVSARVKIAGTPLALAWSPLSQRLYVAGVNDDKLSVVDPASGKIEARPSLGRGVVALRTTPSGRHVLALSSSASRAWAVDTSSNVVTGSLAVEPNPDQIVFSGRFGYVRSLASTKVTMIDLKALERGEMASNVVPMFQKAPNADAAAIGVSDIIAPSPDGEGVVMANGADFNIYYYMEGMMAPQGTFQTYKRAPRALMVRDQSLREVEPGVYVSRLQPERPGKYVLPVLLNSPRAMHCFDVAVGGVAPSGEKLPIDLVTKAKVQLPRDPQPGQVAQVQVRLTDGKSGKPLPGLTDVQIMVMQLPGLWQQRQVARELSPGVYAIDQRLLQPGKYRIRVAVESRGAGFDVIDATDFDVGLTQASASAAVRTPGAPAQTSSSAVSSTAK